MIRLVVDRLILFSITPCETLVLMSSLDLIKLGFCDPIKVFVKDEPHKPLKITEGRLRLISSMSVVDQIVERYMFGSMNNAEIKRWNEIPSKPGLSLTDVGLRQISNYVHSWKNKVSLDVSAWDWSFSGRDYATDFLYRSLATRCSIENMELMWKRMRCLSLGAFVFYDGRVVFQEHPGIMKSGSYLTSSTNSHVACMLAYKAGAHKVMAMGDDVVADVDPNAHKSMIDYYYSTGRRLKVDSNEVMEFCSHVFVNKPHPKDVSKMVCKLLSNLDPMSIVARLANFKYEVRNSLTGMKIYRHVVSLMYDEFDGDSDIDDIYTGLLDQLSTDEDSDEDL